MYSLKLMKVFCQTIFFGFLLLGVTSTLSAQQKASLLARQPSEFADTRPNYCWRDGLILESITNLTPANETIIVIARLGIKDTKPNLNKLRLHNIRAYWTQYLGESIRRKPETVILAESEPTKGYGQVEFYVGGRLVEIIKAHPNSYLNAADCYTLPDEKPCAEEWQRLFYPCKDSVKKQKQKVASKKKKF
jgi:hypothetical protein